MFTEALSFAEGLKIHGMTPGLEGKTVVVQGFGNVGYHAAKFLSEDGGCKVIAVSDITGAVFNPGGLDIGRLNEYRNRRKTLRDFPGAQTLNRAEGVLELDCDILVPAALENQITLSNVHSIRARMIAEAANGPTTPKAEEILLKKGKFIVPDIYLNAGGVTVSYFEWNKNLTHMRYGRMQKRLQKIQMENLLQTRERLTGRQIAAQEMRRLVRGPDEVDIVNSGLEETMIAAYHELLDIRRRFKNIQDLRTAAYVVAIQKIARAYLELGIFP